MRASYRVGAALVGAASFAAGATVAAGPANADVANLSPSLCNGQPYSHSVGTYTNVGHADLPLRCGNNSFGINHMVNRGHPVDSFANLKIKNTLIYGEQKDSGAKELFDEKCNPLYLVAYGYNPYRGNDPNANPVGIITAYPLNNTVTTAAVPAVAAQATSSGYGKNCPIIVLVSD
jgi:hypothetical protein